MTTPSIDARVVEKIIAVLSAETDVTKYVGTRIYGSHLSTIRDYVLPAISIHISDGVADVDEIFGHEIFLQIDIWLNGTGQNAYVWDDVMECFQAMNNAMHRVRMADATIGIKVIESTLKTYGPQMSEKEGAILHFPTRWKFRAVI